MLAVRLNLLKHMVPDMVFQVAASTIVADFRSEICEIPVHVYGET